MISFLLDTALLAIPNYAIDAGSAEEIIARSFGIAALVLANAPIALFQSDTAQDVLWGGHCGPDFQNIEEFLDLMGLTGVYAANDILRVYNTILDRCPLLSEVSGVVDQFSVLDIVPNLVDGGTPVVLAFETQRCIVNAASQVRADRMLGLVPGWHNSTVHSLQASYDATSYLPSTSGEPTGLNVQIVPLLPSPLCLALHGWSGTIWQLATTALDIHLSIVVRLIEMQLQAGKPVDQLLTPTFHVGSHFLASLQAWQAYQGSPYARLVLDVCAQIVIGECNRYQRPMGPGAQTVRATDGAGAIRVHLTDSHEALRLMYWLKDAVIEFANVGPKFELVIESGKPGLETRLDGDLITS